MPAIARHRDGRRRDSRGSISRGCSRELAAAGIEDPELRAAYAACRSLNARHGKSYYLATLLLPAGRRPAVHALYGFARWIDDVIDEDQGSSREDKLVLLDRVESLVTRAGPADGRPAPVVALQDTLRRWKIDPQLVVAFLSAMRMDLSVEEYESFPDLHAYMWGSACVIGLQMLPILRPVVDRDVAAPFAVDLGVAFQMTNFIRDVGEDLARGRIYLPQQSLRTFGVGREQLEQGIVDEPLRRMLAFEIARTRQLYRRAEGGIGLLDPASRGCVRTALRLYEAILDEVERRDYQVLAGRARVPTARRLALAAPGVAGALWQRVRRDN
jgi:phytoene synthase